MLRRFYCWLLRLHPPYFRQRFADEMVLIFDEKVVAEGSAAAKLVADAVISLARQWILRPEFWEQPERPATDGMPHFLSFTTYKPRRGALLYGALLSAGVFTLFTIAFSFGIHEARHTPYSSVSDRNSKTAHSQRTRTQFGGTAISQDQGQTRVKLGPRSKVAPGIWSRLITMFAKSSPEQQLGNSIFPGHSDNGVSLRAIASTKSAGRSGDEVAVKEIRNLKVQLPYPSGKYGVARVAYDWVDGTRRASTANDPDARRELMVYLWYPIERNAERNAGVADYLPHADLIARNLSHRELEKGWGNSWPRIFAGDVFTDTHRQSPIARDEGRFPLLIFSPGLGFSSTSYTAQIQEIVSHGYIVASIEPDEIAVAFPDGRVAHAMDTAWVDRPTMAELSSEKSPEAWADYLDRMHTAGMPHVESRAADIHFVIDQLAALDRNGSPTFPFAGQIDFNNIGVWGHSLGGRAAARACQLDGRIKACLNADGVGPDGPLFPYESAGLPRQPFMWMEASQLPPAINSILTSYKIRHRDSEKDRQPQRAAREHELRACPSGSYHLIINDAATDHFSFTDMRLLEADRQEEFDKASRALEPIEAYSIAFFDKYLKHQETVLLDGARDTAQITLKKYGKAR